LTRGFAFSRNASTLPWSPIRRCATGGSRYARFLRRNRTYKDAAGLEHVVSIVGIDEVDLDRGYISWRSPLANALMKASPGDRVHLRAPAKTEYLEIIEVEYAPIPMDPFREPLGAESKRRSNAPRTSRLTLRKGSIRCPLLPVTA